MSIFNIGRPAPAPSMETTADRWWNWNPARPKPVAAPVVVAPTERWWRWNPYRTTVKHAEAQGRRDGYGKGVRDEQRVMQRRQRRRSHPIFALLVLLAAAGGVTITGLAFETGSFAGAGAVVDQKIGEWRADLVGGGAPATTQGGHAVQTVAQPISGLGQPLSLNAG